ncbi:MAG: hypothetical protein J5776_00455 [Clostridiales bacterium]|nr:hypothetical protein [Clostridiales bacterium]
MIDWFFKTVGVVGGWIIIGSVLVFIIAVICFKISKAREKKREEYRESLGDLKRKEQVIKGVTRRDRVNSGEVVEEKPVERDTGIKVKDAENVQQQQEVFGKVMKSRKKHQPTERELAMQKYADHMVVNGYLQKSNTAPIRPVYSNTASARQQQKTELNSDEVGEEATTPAIVTDSAAPAKIKPTELKPPTSSRANEPQESSDESYVKDAIRPVIGSSVANSVPERPAEVPDETPKILQEEEPLPTATEPAKGFAPAKENTEE